MMVFWSLVCLMCLFTIAVIMAPIFFHTNKKSPSEKQLSLTLYKQRFKDLEIDKNTGDLTADEFDQACIELQKSFLNEIPPAGNIKTGVEPPNKGVVTLVILSIVLIIAALIMYLKLGASNELSQYKLAQKDAANIDAEIMKLGNLQNIIAQLKQQVENKPDGHGWFLLGRLYLKAQQYKEAVSAFALADELTPNQPDIMVSYAEALYLADGNKLNQQAISLLQHVLKSQPQQPDAINLLALNAYSQKDYLQAIAYWQQLLTQFSPESPASKELLQMIASAQQFLLNSRDGGLSGGRSGSVKSSAAVEAEPLTQIKLPVEVTIADYLKKQLKGDESLFVFAQAVNGPPMPLAVVRRSVKDLPLRVVLDEKMAMMANLSLADFKEVRIIARISKSGQPLPSAGDFEGRSRVVRTEDPPMQITVVIDSRT